MKKNSSSPIKFAKSHEWVLITKNQALIGISDHAQNLLGDVVFVDLPPIGKELNKGDIIGNIESVKTVSDIFSPISGKVSEVNGNLTNEPELVNSDPYEKGWLVKIEIDDANSAELSGLMGQDDYKKYANESS
ncbi:MAG: glycine cleavage system protein GcvH [SAR324 cluster bacterium]|nr:glycine cleavage system protein GcvH [SAR324 cluster bacterium]